MCGILVATKAEDKLDLVKKSANELAHRGPDDFDHIITDSGHVLCHHRLSIIDLESGRQPIKGESSYLVHNGEIYNHEEIRDQIGPEKFTTHSDSEAILRLYEKSGIDILNELDGVFAFVIAEKGHIFAGRDPIGVKPLFYGYDVDGNIWFASEQKALKEACAEIHEFPPGHYFTPLEGFVQYYKPSFYDGVSRNVDGSKLREKLTNAVKKRLMSDVPLGVLLSGGLDSSLVASIASREYKKMGKKLMSFSVGLTPDSPDLVKARKVARFLGTDHYEFTYTVEEGIARLAELIEKIETYDVTSIRASLPMYIMSEKIRELGVKVVLSGEGADEIFGGYLYFSLAPSSDEFFHETVRRVKRLHTSDVLRADRSTMAHAIEARVPFLDKEFLDEAMNVDAKLKMIAPGAKLEKHVLRKAFDDLSDPYLPEDVLWRQKEQFSDGVGYSWVDSLKEYAQKKVIETEYALREDLFPINTPDSKEGFFYRAIFEEIFSHKSIDKNIKRWIPKWQENKDPSGRASKLHVKTTEEGQKLSASV